MRRLSFLRPRNAGVGLLLLAASWGTGCGYALVGRATSVPDDVRSVYLKTFENRTNRVQLDEILTRAVADELVTRKRFQLSPSADGAQAEIRGTVIGLDVTPVSLDAQGRATEYQIIITAQVRFLRSNEAHTVLWASDRYQFRRSYPVDVSRALYFDRENLALEDVSQDFAETMVSDLLEGF
jgi:outer membrane lipopolysaccharide assembly protein LptE/RlpB